MVMFQVIGYDTTILLAAQAGQLELNVMMPVIAFDLLNMMEMMIHSIRAFDEKCLKGIKANPERIQGWVEQNPIIVTALNPFIGYQAGADLVKRALRSKQPVQQFILKEIRKQRLIDKQTGKPITEEEYQEILKTLLG